jgi:hypothetical protein
LSRFAWVNLCVFINYIAFEEYERTVIFRLGRLLSGGARGPGVFFIIPCVDIFEKIDLRVQNFDVPPQEVISHKKFQINLDNFGSDSTSKFINSCKGSNLKPTIKMIFSSDFDQR